MQIKYILHQGMSSVVFPEENKLIETALILNSDFLSTRRHDISAPMKSVPLISLFCSLPPPPSQYWIDLMAYFSKWKQLNFYLFFLLKYLTYPSHLFNYRFFL